MFAWKPFLQLIYSFSAVPGSFVELIRVAFFLFFHSMPFEGRVKIRYSRREQGNFRLLSNYDASGTHCP